MEKITITREFDAPVQLVWEAWTMAENIAKWWGPKGYTTVVKAHDFKPGGRWEYIMVDDKDGKEYPAVGLFKEIVPLKKITSTEIADEAQIVHGINMPRVSMFSTLFEDLGNRTKITLEYAYPTLADKDKHVQMGVEGGWNTSLDKLTFYMQTQQTLRNTLKTTTMARVTTYLNFPGNTEEAFLFYKKVFRSEFSGKGMQRFGDIQPHEGMPPLLEDDKKLIIHVELPILGGHILMATDAPASFGFTLTSGNNMHISLEPESKEETTRLFNELSEGGKVDMEMQDMFFGAYYGSCTDKYGINWMFNFKYN